MISSINVDSFIISFILFFAFILLFIFSIFRFYLLTKNKYFDKSYTALLINPNQIIEMKIPINKQQQTIEVYPRPIQTETFYSCDDANEDYYRSILSMNEIPYFLVRETCFQKDSKIKSEMITDSKKVIYSNVNEISDV